jgi:hypothetical protein
MSPIIVAEGQAGMGGWISAFQSSWNTGSMWGELTAAGALIGLVVVFAFGYRVIRKLVKGVSKGKANI